MADPRGVIRELFDRVAAKDLAGASALFADDAVFTDAVGPTTLEGRAAIAQMIAEMWEGLPDIRVEVRKMIADGSTVMVEIELVGTHLGSFLGRAPTGRSIRWPGVARYELDNDCKRILAESFFYDSASLLAQLDPI